MKCLFTILIFFSLTAYSQDTPYVMHWTGYGHKAYSIQQSRDDFAWSTIAVVPSIFPDSQYSQIVPGPTYLYRVTADQDTSQAILVYNDVTLGIHYDSTRNPAQIKELSFKAWQDGQIRFEVKSNCFQVVKISLVGAIGNIVAFKDVTLYNGKNNFTMNTP